MTRAGGLSHLLRWQHRLLARQSTAGGSHRSVEAWILAGLLALRTPVIVRQCRQVVERLGDGPPLRAAGPLEALLGGLLASWILVSIVLGGARADGPGLSPRRLVRYPVSSRDRIWLSLAAFLSRPVAVVLLLQSLIAFWPLARMPWAPLAVVSWPLVVGLGLVTAWALDLWVSHLGEGRRGLLLGLVVTAGLVGLILVAGRSGLERAGDSVMLISLWGRLLLDNGEGAGLIPALRSALPPGWVAGAGLEGRWWPGLAAPILLGGIALELTRRLMDRRLGEPASAGAGGLRRPRAIRPLAGRPGPVASLVAFDFRLQSGTPEWRINFVLGLATAGFVLFWDKVVWWLLPISLSVILLSGAVQAVNAFGLDGPGLERWFLAPIRGIDQVRARNLSFLISISLAAGPALVAGLFAFGPAVTLPLILATGGTVLMIAAFGNGRSLAAPATRRSTFFGSSAESGGVLSLIGNIGIITLPALIALYTARAPRLARGAALAAWLVVAGFLWLASLRRAGARFEREAEELREAMAQL